MDFTTRRRGRAAAAWCLIGAGMCLSGVALAGSTVRSGHAGHWYAADRSGEGWVLELRDAGNAWLYWFTYDSEGRQRWLTAAGQVVTDGDDGQRIDFPELVVTRGARFGSAFNPDDVIREAVGSASLRFEGCDNGQFSYDAFNQTQTFEVQRLAHVMGTRCETPHGVTGREVADHAGQSGSWYDPTHNGEGYALHWATPDQAIVTWYSYDGEGNQYWMLGTGQLDADGRIHFPDVHATRGARFGAAFDPDDVERFAWGELSFELACGGGSASYESVLPAFGSGDFDLSRLTSLHEVACPWQPPKLDALYAAATTELPVEVEGTSAAEVSLADIVIDDDGAIWSLAQVDDALRVVQLEPGAETWRLVGDVEVGHVSRVGLHLRDGVVYANAMVQPTGSQPVWWDGDDWQPLLAETGTASLLSGLSAAGNLAVGYDLSGEPATTQPWRWDAETGQTPLAIGDDALTRAPIPVFASDDGSRVIGRRLQPPPGVGTYTDRMLVWEGDAAPIPVTTADGWGLAVPGACGADCAVVFGSIASRGPGSPPTVRWEPWYHLADGRSAFLGRLSEAGHQYPVRAAAADGNLVVGSYGSFPSFSGAAATAAADPLATGIDGYIWTPLTGMVSARAVLSDAGHDLSAWQDIYTAAVSPDGRRIVIAGQRLVEGSATTREQALLVLDLSPGTD